MKELIEFTAHDLSNAIQSFTGENQALVLVLCLLVLAGVVVAWIKGEL